MTDSRRRHALLGGRAQRLEGGAAQVSSTAARIDGASPHGAEPPLLAVRDLRVEFALPSGTVRAVNGLDLDLRKGETLAILGESGSGKSVSAQAMMGLLDGDRGQHVTGSVRLRGTELLGRPESEWRKVRGNAIGMVFQSALAALNPSLKVGAQLAEILRVRAGYSRSAAQKGAIELMDRVRIPSAAARYGDYPHQFSGGMKQRIVIASAIALEPDVLIADEPTTALDVTVQAQIMELLAALQAESGMGMILITHDLGVAAAVATRVAVMYAGRIMDTGPTGQLLGDQRHPYTAGLMRSVLEVGDTDGPLHVIPGAPPDLRAIPAGCEFGPRCWLADDFCHTNRPRLEQVGVEHLAACHYADKVSERDE